MSPPLVILDPKKEVHFPGPYNKPFTAKLVIENVSQGEVAFRLMTLEPRHYIVDPSKAIVQAHKSATVSITLKPIENQANFKTATQKFMVQVVPAKPDSTNENISELFSKALVGDINYFKLIAVFDNLGKPEQADFVTCSEPSTSSASTSKTSTVSSSASSSPKVQPSFDKFVSSKTEMEGAEQGRSAETLKTNSSSSELVENGKAGEDMGKDNKTEVKADSAKEAAPAKEAVPAKESAPVKQATPSKAAAPAKKVTSDQKDNKSVNSSQSSDSECPYMSSYKYLAIAAGIVLLGAIIYRQCTRSSCNCAGKP